MRIAVDAMGGDRAPEVVIEGALAAARNSDNEIVLVGPEREVREHLSRAGVETTVEVVDAPQVIEPHEQVTSAIRKKRDSSIGIATRLQRDGVVDAFVSAGSTGAVMAFSLLTLGRLGGVNRPAIAALFPTRKGFSLVLDVGANSDCKPLNLLQFALMGSIYTSHILRRDNPTVGLLSMGQESRKGNELTQAAYELLDAAPLHFIGNLEGGDILKGDADVVVTDGFVGNAVLKFGESIIELVGDTIRSFVQESFKTRLGMLLAQDSFRGFMRRMSYEEYGGAPLLGINGATIICHGRSTARALENAITTSSSFVRTGVNQRIQTELAQLTRGMYGQP
jgi:glycerol-3-phosphate acyltransferase PlsX